ncbi:MAG: hypothetical protein ABIJ52_19320 [Pseudomonadota bacterium]
MKFKEIYETVKFNFIKLPFIYLLILMGFVLEFAVELPFMIKCSIGTIFGKRS